MEFELDDRNRQHLIYDDPERGITQEILDEVITNRPRAQANKPAAGRTATHRIVGPDNSGRFWTFPSIHITGEVWRPITGWPSTNPEIATYQEDSHDDSD